MRYELHAASDEMDLGCTCYQHVERVNLCFSLALLLGEEVQNTLLSFSNLTRSGLTSQKAMIYDRQRVKGTDVRIDGPENEIRIVLATETRFPATS